MGYNVVILGGTGLVGSSIARLLAQSKKYTNVFLPVRKLYGLPIENTVTEVCDFSSPDKYLSGKKIDTIIIALGTTLKKAGSIKAFQEIDFGIPYHWALAAKSVGIEKIIVVSSVGSNSESANYYLRTKGELEQAICNLGYKSCIIFRPSMILGKRKEKRVGEIFGKIIMFFGNPLLSYFSSRFQGLHYSVIARAIVRSNELYGSGNYVVEAPEIKFLGTLTK